MPHVPRNAPADRSAAPGGTPPGQPEPRPDRPHRAKRGSVAETVEYGLIAAFILTALIAVLYRAGPGLIAQLIESVS